MSRGEITDDTDSQRRNGENEDERRIHVSRAAGADRCEGPRAGGPRTARSRSDPQTQTPREQVVLVFADHCPAPSPAHSLKPPFVSVNSVPPL